MVASFLTGILNKEDVIKQIHQTFTDTHCLRIITLEILSDLALCLITLRQDSILDIFSFHFFCQVTEHLPQYPIISQRL